MPLGPGIQALDAITSADPRQRDSVGAMVTTTFFALAGVVDTSRVDPGSQLNDRRTRSQGGDAKSGATLARLVRTCRDWVAPVGITCAVFVQAVTDSWATAFVSAGVAIAAVFAAGGVALAVRASRRRDRASARPVRRIGWGSRIVAVVAAAVAVGSVVDWIRTSSPPAKHDDVVGGAVAVAILVFTLTGLSTGVWRSASRALWRSLPADQPARRLTIALLSASALSLLMAWACQSSVSSMRTNGVEAAATVTAVTHLRGADTYFFRYTLPSGEVVRCSTEDVRDAYNEGDHVQVLYDSTDPSACQSADYGTDYGVVYMFGGVGAALATAGIARWAITRRRIGDQQRRPDRGTEPTADPNEASTV